SAAPGNHFIQDCTQAEDVTAYIQRLSFGLLWRQVGRCAHYSIFDRIECDSGICACNEFGQSEVKQFRGCVAIGDHDVRWLQIAMNDASPMRLLQSACDLNRQTYGLLRWQRNLKRFAVDVLHHQIIRADIVQLADVGMIQRRNSARFRLEAIAVLTLQPLDRYDTIETCITSFPYLSHAASTNRRNQQVGA